MTSITTDNISFSNFALSSQLARAIEDMDYTEATSIQSGAIPLLLQGHDVIGHSSTGTGKTAAFGIPAVEQVDGTLKQPQVLVLSPTRELALQISREMQKYAKYKEGVCVVTVYGGAPMSDQIKRLKRANIVVGTPGRLLDHLRRKTLKMGSLKMVVLDEADEMLSMGFIEDIQTILGQAPEERQTVLFSATMAPPILKISEEFLHSPQVVDVMAEQDSQADIRQTYYHVPQQKKKDALLLLLQHSNASRSIVFCNTKSMVDELAILLRDKGFAASGLHGDMTQAVRTQVMQGFRDSHISVLVATDVAARGIDVHNVESVINFDLPQSFEYYVHRIGRTGRAGRQGVSQTLVCNGKQVATLRALMRFTGSDIEECQLPTSADMMERTVADKAAELLPLLRGSTGKAAQMLVQSLLEQGGEDITTAHVAYALAEKLLGGDKQFASIAPVKAKQTATRKAGDSSMVTVTANIGRNARVTPNHLVGAIAELLDIPGSSIGKIDIKPESSQIGLEKDVAQALLAHKKPLRINGTPVTFKLPTTKKSSSTRSPKTYHATSKGPTGRTPKRGKPRH